MSDDKNIKNYSAADLEKYWKGLLTNRQMHALEKAAIEDPFLADALEGFKNSKSSTADLEKLKDQLREKTGSFSNSPKIISLNRGWWKVAAILIGLAGIGFLSYRLIYNNSPELANNPPKVEKKEESIVQELPATDSEKNIDPNNQEIKKITDANQPLQKDKPVAGKAETPKTKNISDPVFDKAVNVQKELTATVVSSSTSATLIPESEKTNKKEDIATIKQPDSISATGSLTGRKSEILNAETKQANSIPQASREQIQSPGAVRSNKNKPINYSGQVVDTENNAIPYASILNITNNKNALATNEGYFTIPAEEDSLLLLEINAQGFEKREFKLNRYDRKNNQLILYPVSREDAKQGQLSVSAEFEYETLTPKPDKSEYPEPEFGWALFNQYLANNLLKDKSSLANGDVTLSFTVNSTGKPVNISVLKSLNNGADNEARRLLKEGPKWIAKGKISEVKIIFHFQ